MELILIAASLYVIVFTFDYLHFRRQPAEYRYVSRETYLTYALGIVLAVVLFHMELHSFFSGMYWSEMTFVLGGYAALLACSLGIMSSGERVCTVILRSERCITPKYVLVKTKEALFQQLLLLIIALGVAHETQSGFWGVILFMVIALLIQIPQLLHVERFWRLVFMALQPFLAAIFYYCYITLGHFWPALYVQAVIYVFIWITFSDPDEYVGKTVGIGG